MDKKTVEVWHIYNIDGFGNYKRAIKAYPFDYTEVEAKRIVNIRAKETANVWNCRIETIKDESFAFVLGIGPYGVGAVKVYKDESEVITELIELGRRYQLIIVFKDKHEEIIDYDSREEITEAFDIVLKYDIDKIESANCIESVFYNLHTEDYKHSIASYNLPWEY